ncbi:uncharacterized protein PRCAT00004096001 [Priceomyces carsonii]|uniref:uncharacterized protein n=1 Tax=Priceomyces carsonii TaxID=28549 RepID=UPI002ED960C6|nr:unnamed protein product [Priceomyces carsonii]
MDVILLPVVGDKVLIFELDDIKSLRKLDIPGVLVGTLPKYPQQNLFLSKPLQLSFYETLWLVQWGYGRLIDNRAYNDQILKGSNISMEDNIIENQVITRDTQMTNKNIALENEISIEQFIERNYDSSKELEDLIKTYNIFKYMKSLGFFISLGLKFGGEFLCYPGDPLRYHSHLIVNACSTVTDYDLITGGRLATGVKKLWVIVDATKDKHQPKKEEDGRIFPNFTESSTVDSFSIEWAGFG